MTKDENMKVIADALVPMTVDEYFAESNDRKIVTPENIGGLLEYPALFHAMSEDPSLRPPLSEAMSTGRALTDFLSLKPEDFLAKYVVADGPLNPKTGKPYGADTKAFIEWKAMQPKTPVPTQQFNMFGKMALAYNKHAFIKSVESHARLRNIVLRAVVNGVECMCKVDNMHVGDDSAFAVDVKTTSDLGTFAKASYGLHYPEQQALIKLILAANGIEVSRVMIAALEKGPLPRCGVFAFERTVATETDVKAVLSEYAESCKTGSFGTRFEDVSLI